MLAYRFCWSNLGDSLEYYSQLQYQDWLHKHGLIRMLYTNMFLREHQSFIILSLSSIQLLPFSVHADRGK